MRAIPFSDGYVLPGKATNGQWAVGWQSPTA